MDDFIPPMHHAMKLIDVIAALLLVVGGLNWGLYGLFGLDLVASIGGPGTVLSQVVYALVGLAALHQAVGLRAIQARWNVSPARSN